MKQAQWHLHPLRVRYEETDRMGVVFHANYATWFEIGRTELVRSCGFPYADIEKNGLLLPVVELNCRFAAPARYDDEVIVCTRIAAFSPSQIQFQSQARKISGPLQLPEGGFTSVRSEDELPGELLVSGGTKHVWINSDWKPVRLQRTIPELYDVLKTLSSEEEAG
ncbi:acyl-CoA thioesterase [Paenibacillus beijingensis]|uniref:Thioesterase n=1 Tax=Paenibacillus beijingensis TaxID=1126833 RepID=A0A0D5NM31_9BACL|nr:thioesterase family protein [Paenibacillus beijingensis]AJY75993.1 thioesterase [Paenibacillus beijingensis]